MKRLATAALVLGILIPLQGAIAGSASTSGADVAFYHPASSSWSLPGTGDFYYGVPGDTPLLCDWNGDDIATVGVYRESTGYLLLHDGNRTGAADYEFYYGIPGDRPLCGDWNGDGVDTIGIYRPSSQRFYLRNQNTHGVGDKDFQFGFKNGIPFAGDFNGDGVDTVGMRDPKNGWLELAPGNYSGTPVVEGFFGSSTDTLVVGDWDGDGTDRLGVYRPSSKTLAVTELFSFARVATYDLTGTSGIPLAAEFDASGGLITSQAEVAETPPTEAPPPPPPAPAPEEPPVEEPPSLRFSPPAADAGWYGTGIKGRGLRPRTAGASDWALGTWEAPRTGNLDSLALYFVFAVEGNYFKGSGGINRFSIRPDVNGQPGQTVLGEFTITNPTAPAGIWSDWETSRGSAEHFAFKNPVTVTAGTKYWIVAENLHPDPTNNWVGINALTEGDGGPGTAFVYIETSAGSNVFERFVYEGEGWFAGLFDLTYQEGDGFGQGYYHAWFDQSVGGAQRARQVLTPSSQHTVTDLRVWAKKTGGGGALTATLSSGGGVVAQASSSGTGLLSFSLDTTLQAGTTYYLEFSAPSGTAYTFTSLRENSGWSTGSRFVEGYSEYDAGSGWSGGWPIWGSTRQDGDLMFYFLEN
ncbi:MAG: hypothetical protein HKN80_09955 [Acidimicrobiia bacterium]|nr:hypothetical protein [Acidimicrobiia bacterium]